MKTNKESKLIAVILVLTLVITIAGIAANFQTATPSTAPSRSTGEVQIFVTEKAQPSSTTGEVTLVVI